MAKYQNISKVFNFRALNLSFNDFDGTVPEEGIFKNATAFSVVGNSKLCGGIPDLKLPKCKVEYSKKSRLSFRFKIVISTAAVLLGVISVILVFLVLNCLRRSKRVPVSSNSPHNSLWNISYHTLSQATNGFSAGNLLGAGSYGSVYRGTIGQEGTSVAVKVQNLSTRGALKSFIAECEALRNIRHRNLVKVLTACSGVDLQGDDFKALVYEFMANGSLEDWLHSKDSTLVEIKSLNLLQRLNTAIDMAYAVAYLHLRCETPIIHCDLKPSNVLLDDELVSRVGDFGLARFLSADAQSFSINQTSSSLVRGTIGYTAPEYGMRNELSTYGDMYSFGILLLEMFTGKRPTDEMFTDGFNLHNFVQDSLPNRVEEIADPVLFHNRQVDTIKNIRSHEDHGFMGNRKIEKCLISVFRVGESCSVTSPKERMNISNAVNELHSIRDALLET